MLFLNFQIIRGSRKKRGFLRNLFQKLYVIFLISSFVYNFRVYDKNYNIYGVHVHV